MTSYKAEICLKEKNPPRAQIFRLISLKKEFSKKRFGVKPQLFALTLAVLF